ncbi:uncharacterized protein BXZ73DRAFT_100706 [Epithele typhae]|uniref:uncharacterized protein n=1 Tax=Epithele typhae TaxID=378194 RepID=UPI0020077298|nr:uncharacterized protein BXZ73DRAFT_100706 [Epithele typhae]KAH9934517.1 hypothetical protein BXZ73DRAFT_100706 [Epithele typhae]
MLSLKPRDGFANFKFQKWIWDAMITRPQAMRYKFADDIMNASTTPCAAPNACVDDRDADIQYIPMGRWVNVANAMYFDGTARSTTVLGAQIAYPFAGNGSTLEVWGWWQSAAGSTSPTNVTCSVDGSPAVATRTTATLNANGNATVLCTIPPQNIHEHILTVTNFGDFLQLDGIRFVAPAGSSTTSVSPSQMSSVLWYFSYSATLNTGAIAGLAVAIVALLIALATVIIVCRRRRRSRSIDILEPFADDEKAPMPPSAITSEWTGSSPSLQDSAARAWHSDARSLTPNRLHAASPTSLSSTDKAADAHLLRSGTTSPTWTASTAGSREPRPTPTPTHTPSLSGDSRLAEYGPGTATDAFALSLAGVSASARRHRGDRKARDVGGGGHGHAASIDAALSSANATTTATTISSAHAVHSHSTLELGAGSSPRSVGSRGLASDDGEVLSMTSSEHARRMEEDGGVRLAGGPLEESVEDGGPQVLPPPYRRY